MSRTPEKLAGLWLASFSACRSPQVFPALPEDIDYYAVFTKDALGRIDESTAITKRMLDEPILVATEDATETWIVGWTSEQIEGALSGQAPSEQARVLAPAACEGRLPAAAWFARWVPPEVISSRGAAPPLTTDEFRSAPPPPECTRCPSFTFQQVDHPAYEVDGLFAIPWSGGRTLAGTKDLLVLVSQDGSSDVYAENLGITAAVRVRDEPEIWAGRGRELGRLRLEDLRFSTVATASTSGSLKWMSASGPGDPEEVFALSSEGRLFHYDGQTLREVAVLAETGRELSAGSVVRLGPGRALAVGDDQPEILLYEDGQPRFERPFGSFEGFLDAADIPGRGTLIAHQNGALLHFDDPGFTTIVSVPPNPQAMAPLGGGIIFGFRHLNRLGYLDPALQSCPQTDLPGPFQAKLLAPLGQSLLLATALSPGMRLGLLIARPTFDSP